MKKPNAKTLVICLLLAGYAVLPFALMTDAEEQVPADVTNPGNRVEYDEFFWPDLLDKSIVEFRPAGARDHLCVMVQNDGGVTTRPAVIALQCFKTGDSDGQTQMAQPGLQTPES